jgi:hypothetical protein
VPSTQNCSLVIHIPLVFASSLMKRSSGAENQHGAGPDWAKLLLVSGNRLWYSTWTLCYFTWMLCDSNGTRGAAVSDGTRLVKIKPGNTAAIAGLSSIQSIRLAVCGS